MPSHADPVEFPCPGPVTVHVRLGGGSVEIVAEPRDTATVDVAPIGADPDSRTAAERTRVRLRGGQLRVDAPDSDNSWAFRRSPEVRIRIRVPPDCPLAVKVASAEVTCRGRYGPVSLATASGDVAVEHATGDVSVGTSGGGIALGRVDGRVWIKGASAGVTVARAGGDVTAYTASGNVTIERADGSVKVNTAAGDVRIGEAHRGTVRIKSASGDVSVGVRPGTGVWLDLSTMGGATRSNLAITEEPRGRSAADLTVSVRTMSGDVDVFRVPMPAAA